MSATGDIIWRLLATAVAAAGGFGAALWVFCRKGGLAGRGVYVAAALYGLVILADASLLVAPWVFGAGVRFALPFTVALYVGAIIVAVMAAQKGHSKAVFTAAMALVMRWFLNILFASLYAIRVKYAV